MQVRSGFPKPFRRRTPSQAPAGAAQSGPDRLWEIDALRTVAIAMMVAYHVAYDVNLLGPSIAVDPFGGGWRALQVATGSTFLLLVGMSLSIANARSRGRGVTGWALYRRHLRRASQVAAAAAAVSIATWLVLGDDWVRFGILHCIAAAMVIAPLLVPLGMWNVALGAAAVAAGFIIRDLPPTDISGLLILGVPPSGGAGVDWYPLLPWIGPALFGVALGRALYPGGRRGPWGRGLGQPRWARAVARPGRHALPIYLAHQPILIALVAVALMLVGAEVSWASFE